MASYLVKSSLALLALSATPVFSSPILPVEGEVVLPAGAQAILPRQDAGQCRNQSCEIATIAGSTGATNYPYSTYPSGYTSDGNCCIIRYFPAVKNAIYAAISGQQAYCAAHGGDAPLDSNPPGVNSVTVKPSKTSKRAATTSAACKPKILIFAKGTGEPFDLGITVGPMLQSSLNATEWDVRGVSYDNSFDNDYCLGLPGGVTARGVLHKAVTDCPNSIIAMSGYSQGAMVAIARAPKADVAHVKNVVNFGDPFDGANIGQYSGPRHVFCMTSDGVCNGQFAVSLAHLSYGSSIAAAVKILEATTK